LADSRLNENLNRISIAGRRAARAKKWTIVNACAQEILKQDSGNPEGWFLSGLTEKAAGNMLQAAAAFTKTTQLDAARYDAAIELAELRWGQARHSDALQLLGKYRSHLSNSPVYLDMAARLYSRLGLHAQAWPLYQRACDLQPEITRFRESLAACAVLLGKIGEARAIYLDLLQFYPKHQRNHYELSRLQRAQDDLHVKQMKALLDETRLPPEENIYLYYALGKELEDLGQWDEAFHYYKKGGNAAAVVCKAAGYDVGIDIDIMDMMIEVCDANWLETSIANEKTTDSRKRPIFIVGLPRTGTTLTERIVASHSMVESAGESFFMRMVIKQVSGVKSTQDMSLAIIEAAARKDIGQIAKKYLEMVDYRLTDRPLFIDKLPENFLYLGFIAKAFPDAHIIHLRRNPMDACFAMYKQSFFRFAYTLEDLAEYYVAYDRLSRHWRGHLGNRIIEVEYESLVSDPDIRIRELLDGLGLEFEQACLDFHLHSAPSATASAVQVREKAHTRSVARWKKFDRHLRPLGERLRQAGIRID
jgi:Tfp pilus assembly protein PilF